MGKLALWLIWSKEFFGKKEADPTFWKSLARKANLMTTEGIADKLSSRNGKKLGVSPKGMAKQMDVLAAEESVLSHRYATIQEA